MKEYHKINSIYKRDLKGKFIIGDFSVPEFSYLQNNKWIFTEKVDGTNIRVEWNHEAKTLNFNGRTDNAQMPVFLMQKIQSIFTADKFLLLYPDTSMLLFGEGYGARIQKGGGNYIPDGVDFILFDVLIGDFYLYREDVIDIAKQLGVMTVPVIGHGTLHDAVKKCQDKFLSTWGNFQAEGIVLRPEVELKSRMGHRIITKVKCKDFA